MKLNAILFAMSSTLLVVGCQDKPHDLAGTSPSSASMDAGTACQVAFSPHHGADALDAEITRLQKLAGGAVTPDAYLERLGWAYIAKAQRRFDPGFFELARSAASCLEEKSPNSHSATLLLGHALHNLHRFSEAEKLARKLSKERGLWLDHALLGDVLAEQGKLDEAVSVYQRMMDLKPSALAYIRAANARWLTGDLEGAIEVARMAAVASSSKDASAWILTRLALLELQSGQKAAAAESLDAALDAVPNYPPALLAKGRIALDAGSFALAVELLQKAVSANPLPDYQWALLEAHRAQGNVDAAEAVNAILLERGEIDDPRTYAIFLATTDQRVDDAVRLAREELQIRQDPFTLDALAWALAANGELDAANDFSKLAVGKGTKDARLFYHAGVIASALGEPGEALRWLGKAMVIRQMLLPSEQRHLRNEFAALESQISGLETGDAGQPAT